jgi:mevalonate kinase
MSKENSQNSDTFHSKIMLFGEYSIILGSMGLTIPYAHFNGSLGFINKNRYTDLDYARRSNSLLTEYYNYIQTLAQSGKLPHNFDADRLGKDLANGLYFESTIPEGYGLGSSGALVAALYHRYKKDKPLTRRASDVNEVRQLKKELAILESWFHGTSSGIDPLICYMKHPLLLTEEQNISPVGIPKYNLTSEDAIFLLNTGKPGKTAPLVEGFMKNCEDEKFLSLMKEEYIPLNNSCIKHLTDGNLDKFTSTLQELSFFQATHFGAMIPSSIEMEWIYGFSTGKYLLKLCGSGGGGFVLGFTRAYQEVKERFMEKGMEIIPVYQIK